MNRGIHTGPSYFFSMTETDITNMLAGRKIALFLDFDGTLTPIREDPAQCTLSEETRELLQWFANSGRHHVTVLSGRTLDDVKWRVGVSNVCYGGNHGLVISGEGMQFVHPGALSAKADIDEAGWMLEKEMERFEGAWVERKNYTLSLHFRMVEESRLPELKSIFYKVAAEFLANGSLTVMQGKKVLELLPDIPWNKGKAVLWILQRLPGEYMPIMVGDDVTDETAFKTLEDIGISIRIARSSNTFARFYLKDYQETSRLLEIIRLT